MRSNQEWEKQYGKPGMEVTLLVPPKRQTKLPKPYQYELSVGKGRSLIEEIKKICAPFRNKLQCVLIEKKLLSRGVRIDVFLLGFCPGFCGDDMGVTKEEWDNITSLISKELEILPDVPLYVEDWSNERKFQLRLETYILFSELQ